jgi:hypothetical protein
MNKTTVLPTLHISVLTMIVILLMALLTMSIGTQAGTVHAAGYDTSIVRTGGVYNYDALKQDAAVNQPFYFRNETKVTQTVTSQGKPFLVIPAGHSAQKIFKQKGSYVFGLASNPKARLTVVVGGGK